MSVRERWNNFWLATDLYIGDLIWEEPDITISSEIARARRDGKWWGKCGCVCLNLLFHVPDHCAGALLHDAERAEEAEKELE